MTWFKQFWVGFLVTLPFVLLVNAAAPPPSVSARGPEVDVPRNVAPSIPRQAGELRPVGIPDSHKSDAISLPEPREVKGNTRLVTLAAATRGEKDEVEWIVFNLADENPVQALANGRALLVFPNDQDDVIVVLAYVKRGAEGASSPVRTLVKVKGSTSPVKPPDKKDPDVRPPNKKDPDVRPPVAAKVVHLSFVIDPSKHTADAAAVVNDRGLREKLAAMGVRVHALTVASRSVTQGGLSAGVGKAGGVPCVILQDGVGNIVDAVPLAAPATILALVAKYNGG